MATQTAFADVGVTWTSPSTQSAFADVGVTWASAVTTQTATADVAVVWTVGAGQTQTAANDVTLAWVAAPGVTISDLTVEPYAAVTLTALPSAPVTTYTWAQTSGPAVTLQPLGASCQFEAPAALTSVTVVIAVTATLTAGGTVTDTATVTALPHNLFRLRGGTWQPMRYSGDTASGSGGAASTFTTRYSASF